MIHEYNLGLFKKEAIQTEGTAYKLLKQLPIKSTNYLAVPWSVLINHGGLNKLKIKPMRGGFTVCQHISYKKIIPTLVKAGINTLFTPHAGQNPKFREYPFPHLAVNSSGPATKDLLYSFIGFDTHHTRRKIFKMPTSSEVVIKQRGKWHFEIPKEKRAAHKKEYIDVLARSRFSLCPRGTGPSTIRFWESLRSGSIPVLIADAMRLPDTLQSLDCMIVINEKNVADVDTIIREVQPSEEERMRSECLKAYKMFSGDNFVSCIRKAYNVSI